MNTIAQDYSKSVKVNNFQRAGIWISRLPLIAATIIFTGISAKFMIDPVHTAGAQGIMFGSGVGITVARIGFGAFPLAFAIITVACLVSNQRLLTGIYNVLTVISVALVVRVFGMIADNSVKESMRVLAPEVVLLGLSILALNLELRRRRLES